MRLPMILPLRPLWFAGVVFASTSLATSSPSDARSRDQAHAQVTLKADTSTVVAGRPFTVAIAFKLDPTWHVYYKDPGESGMPPDVRWTLPVGITAGELQYPKPEVLKTPAGTNFVYHDEVWLLATMTPGKDFKPGSDIEIIADAKWLECDAERCLPGKQRATLTVTAGGHATPANQEQFESWQAKVKEAESFDPAAAK